MIEVIIVLIILKNRLLKRPMYRAINEILKELNIENEKS